MLNAAVYSCCEAGACAVLQNPSCVSFKVVLTVRSRLLASPDLLATCRCSDGVLLRLLLGAGAFAAAEQVPSLRKMAFEEHFSWVLLPSLFEKQPVLARIAYVSTTAAGWPSGKTVQERHQKWHSKPSSPRHIPGGHWPRRSLREALKAGLGSAGRILCSICYGGGASKKLMFFNPCLADCAPATAVHARTCQPRREFVWGPAATPQTLGPGCPAAEGQ